MKTAITVLVDGTAKAAVLILERKRIDLSTVDATVLDAKIKAVIKANIEKVMAEWKDATSAHMPESFLRTLLNAQCNEYGLMAADAYLKGA